MLRGPQTVGETSNHTESMYHIRNLDEVLETNIGHLPGALRDRFRADHIGFVFQMFNLIHYLTLGGNVILPCSFSTRLLFVQPWQTPPASA